MIPRELTHGEWVFPKTDLYTIVLITGSELRHRRFAYRIQQEFKELVVGYFQYGGGPAAVPTETVPAPTRISRVTNKLRKLASFRLQTYREAVSTRLTQRRHKNLQNLRRARLRESEQILFAEEVKQLAEQSPAKPSKMPDPNSAGFLETVRKLDPYFFLSLGGPLYSKELLAIPRGAAINQHAGWSPKYRGSNTVEWALYHRDLEGVGTTVHITTAGADAGPILRRAHPCLVNSDTPENCFNRVVALGTEVMCEVVHDIIANRPVRTYPQPINEGRTFLSKHFSDEILRDMYKDFDSGWLKRELRRLRNF